LRATATDRGHTVGSPPYRLHAVDARATAQKLQKILQLGTTATDRGHTVGSPPYQLHAVDARATMQ